MTISGILQIAIFLGLILICAKPLGSFMAKVFEGQRTFMHPVLRWLEVLTYKVAGVREDVEQRWTHYTASLLSFSIFGFLIVYLLQRAQALLPLNIVGEVLLCSQGVVQNLNPYSAVTTVEGAKQVISQGPVASQEVIKQLGTNGGGFFNANSSHPYAVSYTHLTLPT